MVKIITDSSSLYTQEEAKALGFKSIPLCISIDDWDIRDLDVDMEQFYNKIKAGHVPKSSQPPIGDVVDAYEEYAGEEIINLTMADGLSGTYHSACGAVEMVKNKNEITVINSKTLCGPHRYMVEQITAMAKNGANKEEIIAWLSDKIQQTKSFLMPQDFSFLRRGGRLTAVAATFGGLLKLKPILVATEDGKRLDKFTVKRTLSSAVGSIVKDLEQYALDEKHIVYISHANVLGDAKKAAEIIKAKFPKVEIQMNQLSAAFVTQGGPGCIAIQYIQK